MRGLAALQPLSERAGLALVRPLLDVPKAQLVAHLEAAEIPYARDPSNQDLRHARPRWRALAPALAAEGLTPARLSRLAHRFARADAALSQLAEDLAARCRLPGDGAAYRFDAALLFSARPSFRCACFTRRWPPAPRRVRWSLARSSAFTSALAPPSARKSPRQERLRAARRARSIAGPCWSTRLRNGTKSPV